jgi:hypothetical protein
MIFVHGISQLKIVVVIRQQPNDLKIPNSTKALCHLYPYILLTLARYLRDFDSFWCRQACK